ncbi:hypothetical protein ACFPOI_39595 [Nonomuraea angiospora]|uniref:TetR family transcriptional regulator n=1 Tax=Nonomuraea angiospora TaxID=46172 RepID=A0ABR9M5N1_9ACTN|nr:hypothetical protein [Nonomuraea angiospora]MBE1587905.1 hypothetical protein [Nonomuraea angiospora]
MDVASLEGLNGLSIGRPATDLGLSKSGVATLFGTKEKLQLATAAAAREAFREAVVRPTSDVPPRRRGIRRHTIALLLTWALLKERIKDGKNPQISLVRNRGPAPWIGTYKELASC